MYSETVDPQSPIPPELSKHERQLAHEVVSMYRDGWFPMGEGKDSPIEWVQPTMRAVLPLEPGAFKVSRTLAQRVRSGRFLVTSDLAFASVIQACASPRRIEGEAVDETWITGEIVDIYRVLHRAGLAHSIEAWLPAREASAPAVLVGGLYGLVVGGAFCGESMFSRPTLGGTDASKVALAHLVGHLRRRGFTLLDTQLANDHVAQFGMVEIPRAVYLSRLKEAAARSPGWGTFDAASSLANVPEVGAGPPPTLLA